MKIINFTVPIDYHNKCALIYLLWPCTQASLAQFLKSEFSIEGEERDTWEGKCVFSLEADSKHKCPTAIIALRRWAVCPHEISVLAHESCHAAEWLLSRSNQRSKSPNYGAQWSASEDLAYLVQRIIYKSIEMLSKTD